MKKRMYKKLSINKQTITNLDIKEQEQVRGAGTITSNDPPCIVCPPSYTCFTNCAGTCQNTCDYGSCPLCPY